MSLRLSTHVRPAVVAAVMTVFALASTVAAPSQLSAQAATTAAASADDAAVRAAVGEYLKAHATGDGNHLKKVFHPELKLFFSRDNEVRTRPGPEYIAGFTGAPPADEAQRKRWIEKVEVTGTVATAKVILDYPATKFTDYFQLVKANGEWKIVSKLFHAEPKAKR